MEQMETIKELINQGDVNKAIEALDTLLTQSDFAGKDEVYYLRGNAYRKQGNWQQALNNYQSGKPGFASPQNGNGYSGVLSQGHV